MGGELNSPSKTDDLDSKSTKPLPSVPSTLNISNPVIKLRRLPPLPPPLTPRKKPKDVFDTVKVKRQLAKSLPPPPKFNQDQVESQLADNWVECYTEKGNRYFYNTVSTQSSWYDPRENQKESPSKMEDWEWCVTETGDIYYYNHKTGQSQWDNPVYELVYQQDQKGDIQNVYIQRVK